MDSLGHRAQGEREPGVLRLADHPVLSNTASPFFFPRKRGSFERHSMIVPDPFNDFEDSRALAQAIVDTIREPLLVLDKDLRVVAASRSFFQTFKMNRQDVQGQPIYALGDGQWDIPELRLLLERILPQHMVMDDYEVEQEVSTIGR